MSLRMFCIGVSTGLRTLMRGVSKASALSLRERTICCRWAVGLGVDTLKELDIFTARRSLIESGSWGVAGVASCVESCEVKALAVDVLLT